MSDTTALDVLKTLAAVNLSDTFDFQPMQFRGVSLAVDADSRRRIAAATEAGRLGAAASGVVPFLIEMLGQDRVTPAAGDLVARLQSGKATKEDGRRAENMTYIAEADAACHVAAGDALVAIGAVAVPALTEALRSPVPNRRSEAARALGRIGEPAKAALDSLKQLAGRDDAETVRKAAAEAVKQLKPRGWFS
jgi:hypothetical protein